jgi:hypothetical protein
MWVLVLPSMPKGEIIGKYLTPRGESECMWVLVLPSMPKGEIVGKYLTDSECLSLMASTTMKMA